MTAANVRGRERFSFLVLGDRGVGKSVLLDRLEKVYEYREEASRLEDSRVRKSSKIRCTDELGQMQMELVFLEQPHEEPLWKWISRAIFEGTEDDNRHGKRVGPGTAAACGSFPSGPLEESFERAHSKPFEGTLAAEGFPLTSKISGLIWILEGNPLIERRFELAEAHEKNLSLFPNEWESESNRQTLEEFKTIFLAKSILFKTQVTALRSVPCLAGLPLLVVFNCRGDRDDAPADVDSLGTVSESVKEACFMQASNASKASLIEDHFGAPVSAVQGQLGNERSLESREALRESAENWKKFSSFERVDAFSMEIESLMKNVKDPPVCLETFVMSWAVGAIRNRCKRFSKTEK